MEKNIQQKVKIIGWKKEQIIWDFPPFLWEFRMIIVHRSFDDDMQYKENSIHKEDMSYANARDSVQFL